MKNIFLSKYGSNYRYFYFKFLCLMAIFIAPFYNTHLNAIDDNPAGLSNAEKELAAKLTDSIVSKTKDAFREQLRGLISIDDLKEKIAPLQKELEKIGTETSANYKSQIDNFAQKLTDFNAALSAQSNEIRKLSSNIEQKQEGNGIKLFIKKFLDSPEYKRFETEGARGRTKTMKCEDLGIDTKTVSMTSNYSGTALISRDSGIIVDNPPNRKVHLRDLMNVMPTDKEYVVYTQISSWVDGTDTVAENNTSGETSFSIAEQTASVKRIATFVDVSKRNLKNLSWLQNHLSLRLSEKILLTEDFQLLHGDGVGNNLTGLFRTASVFDLTPLSWNAGAVASVATWDSGTKSKVTFAANHNLRNGWKITFANTTGYNNTYAVRVKNPLQIVIDATYSAGSTAAWTATATNPFYQSIPSAQEFDVLRAAIATLNNGEFMATVIVLNPIDAAKMELLKNSQFSYLPILRAANGILYVGGVPVIETNAISAGQFFAGDMALACELLEFTPLQVYVTDDVTYAKANKVAFIAEEEIILPVYNSSQFLWGEFSTLITEMTEPTS